MKQEHRKNYKADLLADLKDSEYAADYLSASMAESVETFLLALRDVADSQKGMARVASEANVNRENLYRMLSEDGNPRLNSLHAVLTTLGFRISVERRAVTATISQTETIDTTLPLNPMNTNVRTQADGAHLSGRIRSYGQQMPIRKLYAHRTPTKAIYHATLSLPA
jgi:probable addiction module antidote protein